MSQQSENWENQNGPDLVQTLNQRIDNANDTYDVCYSFVSRMLSTEMSTVCRENNKRIIKSYT